jgi:type II secretory pathway pseudopilin PulG
MSTSNESGGFSLVESLVALVLVGTVMLLLAPALFHVANERVTVEAATEREAALEGESDRLSSFPFAELDSEAGCALLTDPFPHTKCIVITPVNNQERQVKIRIVPLNSAVARDSVVMTRTNRRGNPFNTKQP